MESEIVKTADCPVCGDDLVGTAWIRAIGKWRMYCTDCERCLENKNKAALQAVWNRLEVRHAA